MAIIYVIDLFVKITKYYELNIFIIIFKLDYKYTLKNDSYK